MKVLYGKVIRSSFKDCLIENLKNIPLSFYLYYDKDNLDCASYLKSIVKLFDSFSIPYEIGTYEKEKTIEENLSNFQENIQNRSVLLLRPLPIKEEKRFIDLIPSSSDPDMLTDINRGLLFSGDLSYLPATAFSVKTILDYYSIPLENKNAVVIGRSLSLGLPCFELLNQKNANVTLLHSHTEEENLKKYVGNADLIVLATGKPGVIKKEWLKLGVTLIDCGFHGKSGDIDFLVEEKDDISFTPVPFGVGSLTSYCLLMNALLLKAKERNQTIIPLSFQK